jgi:uncharacterized protein (DUF433 family)
MSDEARVVHSDPEILGGTPVFSGTRVPVKSLYDYLEAGDSLDEFLESFPSVTREQAVAALELAADRGASLDEKCRGRCRMIGPRRITSDLGWSSKNGELLKLWLPSTEGFTSTKLEQQNLRASACVVIAVPARTV